MLSLEIDIVQAVPFNGWKIGTIKDGYNSKGLILVAIKRAAIWMVLFLGCSIPLVISNHGINNHKFENLKSQISSPSLPIK